MQTIKQAKTGKHAPIQILDNYSPSPEGSKCLDFSHKTLNSEPQWRIAMAESWQTYPADGPVPNGKHVGVWPLYLQTSEFRAPESKRGSSVGFRVLG